MPPSDPLPVEALAWRCPSAAFEATDAASPAHPLGQDRALDAIDFALRLREPGYNVYAMGPEALGKRDVVLAQLRQAAADGNTPADLCYVTNFDDARRPRLLDLAPGRGRELRGDLVGVVRELKASLAAAFENEEHRTQREMLEQELKDRQETAINEVEARARARSIALLRTPMGFTFMPMRDGEVIPPDAFNQLPEAERRAFVEAIQALERDLQATVRQFPQWVSELRARMRELARTTADYALHHLFEPLRTRYGDAAEVLHYLEAVRGDVLDHVEAVLEIPDDAFDLGPEDGERGHPLLRRWLVNLVVDCAGAEGAPVVVEDDPTYDRLFGRIEHRAEMGALTTDLHLIRAGSLHRAASGYLVLEMERLLARPFAWDALARALERGEIVIEPPLQALGFTSTTTLEPEPAPLDVKVVLLGDRWLYYLVQALDPKFPRLFKIPADFEDEVRHDPGVLAAFARECRDQAEADRVLPLAADGLARLAEFAARRAGDQRKLSTERETLRDVVREADLLARRDGAAAIGAAAVTAAIEARRHRLARLQERQLEAMVDGTLQITTDGGAIGQVNGLSVLSLGDASFGKPSRLTARVRMGTGHLVDIEREVKLGGPLHSKGVLILQGYVAGQYVTDLPPSLHASLVFEQSYGGVEGDSASTAELVALLSALAELPVDQGLALTGAVNQLGEVQAIGGVNEKIEGFFDLCAARGLTGRQGVLIPASNRRHLMLHDRVRDAVADGRFRLHAVAHVDEGLELLLGVPAGRREADGGFTPASVHARVEARLRAFAEARRAFARAGGATNAGEGADTTVSA